MVGGTGIEPVTPCMSSKCSTAELTARHKALEELARLSQELGLYDDERANHVQDDSEKSK